MFMINKILLLIMLLTQPLASLSIKDYLKNGKPGDFIVVEQNKSLNLIRIDSLKGSILILEEILLTKNKKQKNSFAWENFFLNNSEACTSWNKITIDMKNDEILGCYSVTKNVNISLNKEDSFLISLLSSQLHQVLDENRKKIGQIPSDGVDTRKNWNPPLIFDGKKIIGGCFDVFTINFTKNDSLLSNKHLEIYFNKDDKSFPFPYWIQITDDLNLSLKIKICDSGRNLKLSK